MKRHLVRRAVLALAGTLGIAGIPRASHAFDRIQPPEIQTGHRAGLAGSFGATAYGPLDVSRGGFSLPSPFTVPGERGDLQAPIFPTYGPDNGISVWGMGFDTSLVIRRWRLSGSLTYDFAQGDELIGPFGRMTRGTDGAFYPVGLDKPIRVVTSGDDLIAYLPDGTRWIFGGYSIRTPMGTYAWYLRQILDVTGRFTNLSWTANASGNLFLTSVGYGGVNEPSRYAITLSYEAVSTTDAAGNPLPKFVDYRAGIPLTLDRRVKRVTVSAAGTPTSKGAFLYERYHYTLSYLEEPIGAAFYLARVDQTFASGESAPPVMYGYNMKGAGFGSAERTEVPQLTQLFAQLGVTEDIIQPQRAAVTDTDFNGNPDLELNDASRTLLVQKGSGSAADPTHYEVTTLPSAGPACTGDDQTGCVFARCRPVPQAAGEQLRPRLLAQLNPGDDVLQVVDFQYDPNTDRTAVSLCTRDGVRLSKSYVASQWEPSDNVKFVDMNHDHLPDLVRVGEGRYDILPNATHTVGGAPVYGWGALQSGTLLDAFGVPLSPLAVWISDMTGDGTPDIVAELSGALEVWHNLGGLKFTTNAQEYGFTARDGVAFTDLDQYNLIPADLNKDGLQDYFATNADPYGSRFILYFTNVGARFVETPVNAFDTLPSTASAPVVASLDGSGNTSVTVTDDGRAYSIALDGPDTGLMAWADDGKGNVLSFSYARGPASPGIRHRAALLSRMDVQSSGYDVMSYDYAYDAPVVHSVGRFLLGYGQVTRRDGNLPNSPMASHTMSFLNDDRFAGVLLDSSDRDVRAPNMVRRKTNQYADATFRGIPWKRLSQSSEGWVSADGSQQALDVTTFDSYESEVCPSQTTRTRPSGTLVTTSTRANPSALAEYLHCLPGRVARTGHHPDPSLDFSDVQVAVRNDYGKVTQVQTLGSAGAWNAQTITYDTGSRVVSAGSAGRGMATFVYDPLTKLLASMTSPDGVVTRVVSRNPVTDAILVRQIDRGGMQVNETFQYDGQERLVSQYDDLGHASAAHPNQAYAYTYATANTPASVTTTTLVDAAGLVQSVKAELFTATEEKLATGNLSDGGWVIDGFAARSRRQRTVQDLRVANLPTATNFATIDYATLVRGEGGAAPPPLRTSSPSDFGFDTSTKVALHPDVEMATQVDFGFAAGAPARTTRVKDALPTVTGFDTSAKVTTNYTDESGTRYGYTYDVADRLRAVTLPDGSRHTVTYDEYGRVVRVRRDGIAEIAKTYSSVAGGPTDLVATETHSTAPQQGASVAVRSKATVYDAAGRKTQETNTDLASGQSKVFSFFYDGATPDAPTATGATGMLTGVSGTGYAKSFAFRADGRVLRRTVRLDGWRTILTDFAYREDESVRDQTITVQDAAGATLSTSVRHQDVDAFGRLAQTTVNRMPFASFVYDDKGRLGTATFATGDTVSFEYDALTRDFLGMTQTKAGSAWAGAALTRYKKNTRGFIGTERLGIAPNDVQRTYDYSAQGFLTSAIDARP